VAKQRAEAAARAAAERKSKDGAAAGPQPKPLVKSGSAQSQTTAAKPAAKPAGPRPTHPPRARPKHPGAASGQHRALPSPKDRPQDKAAEDLVRSKVPPWRECRGPVVVLTWFVPHPQVRSQLSGVLSEQLGSKVEEVGRAWPCCRCRSCAVGRSDRACGAGAVRRAPRREHQLQGPLPRAGAEPPRPEQPRAAAAVRGGTFARRAPPAHALGRVSSGAITPEAFVRMTAKVRRCVRAGRARRERASERARACG
jgi:hypothetical protein